MNSTDASAHGLRAARQRGRRRTRLLVAAGAAVLAGVVVAGVAVTGAGAAPAELGTIGGTTVTRDELLFHMERVRPAIENEVLVETGSATVDWDAPLGDTTAIDRLRTAALDELAADRVVFELGHEHGLVPFTDFAGFEQTLADTNTARAAQLGEGEVVYGLTSFRAQEFYGRLLADARTKLASAVSSGDDPLIDVSEAQVRDAFDAHADDWTLNASTYALTRIAVPLASTTAEQFAARLATEGVDAVGSTGATVSASTLDGATGLLDGGSRTPDPRLVAEVATLPVGALSSPVVEQGDHVVYRVDTVTVDRDAAFAAYASRIRAQLVNDALDALIAERVAAQDRQMDSNALHQLTMEDTH
ncbi:peptidylprolyl isomerase [Plantibacter sp. ME-Dv--P-095]|uniref:peptidylprolyl isomerase n=1 Tax=Plantibacter sp. ME-Dv--P-095 TaxID=3040299 RepID=UPI0025508679|nr:peptidylprolyl isomerase [Plantibacter sp. ME-Dv--P-095]